MNRQAVKSLRPSWMLTVALLWSLFSSLAPARAELVRFTVTSRQPFAGGRAFGDVGEYEYLTGRAEFAIDPRSVHQQKVVDLAYAPVGEDQRVHFSCDVAILAPRDPRRGNGVLLHEVNNRGGKLLLSFFNDAAGSNTPRDAGNGFLFREGYTIVWCGWNAELQPGSGRLLLQPPSKSDRGAPITGLVRYEWTPEIEGRIAAIAGHHHGAFPPTEKGLRTSTLTWRLRPEDPRVEIPREQYRLRTMPMFDHPESTLPVVEVDLPSGFQKGYLYELIYEAVDPYVAGAGFVAVRDLISACKHGEGEGLPAIFKGREHRYAIGFGVSQSGRFLREFLYSGFNVDEKGRTVFEGLMPHVAGAGMGSFNHRFAQPTAFATPFQKADWAVDRFPFGYHTEVDPLTGKVDSLLASTPPENQPKIIHTQSATEYWSRGGSLVHTDALGKADAEIPDNVRIYAFGATQHSPATYPPGVGDAQTMANPADYRPQLRALLVALTRWVKEEAPPPESVYPRIARRQLGGYDLAAQSFPRIPGKRVPESMLIPAVYDLGPRWEKEGIIDNVPPRLGARYGALAPLTDRDGHDLGCLLPVEAAVPLATHTGWSLRSRDAGAQNQIVGLVGSYILFPLTAKDRVETGDPRRSIDERYRSLDEYAEKLTEACRRMVDAGFLLEEDITPIVEKHRQRAEAIFEQVQAAR